jgi:hypothetical protein
VKPNPGSAQARPGSAPCARHWRRRVEDPVAAAFACGPRAHRTRCRELRARWWRSPPPTASRSRSTPRSTRVRTRGPRLRADPPGEHEAQGGRSAPTDRIALAIPASDADRSSTLGSRRRCSRADAPADRVRQGAERRGDACRTGDGDELVEDVQGHGRTGAHRGAGRSR